MRTGLLVLLAGLLGCSGQPTQAGGGDSPAGRLFFLRAQAVSEQVYNSRLHVTTDASLRRAVPTATAPGVLQEPVRATPDGRYLAWELNGRILTMDRFNGAVTEITPVGGYRDRNVAWFPGGQELVVQRTRPDGKVEYVRVKRDGSDVRVLPIDTLFTRITSLDLSPNGTELLIVRNDYTQPPYLVRLSDGDVQPIEYPRPGDQVLAAVRWSPDGSRFLAFEYSVGAERWIVRGRDGQLLATRELTVVGSPPRGTAAAWSPDGSQIAVCEWVERIPQSSFPRGRNGIVLWSVESGAEEILTPAGMEDCWPEWTR